MSKAFVETLIDVDDILTGGKSAVSGRAGRQLRHQGCAIAAAAGEGIDPTFCDCHSRGPTNVPRRMFCSGFHAVQEAAQCAPQAR